MHGLHCYEIGSILGTMCSHECRCLSVVYYYVFKQPRTLRRKNPAVNSLHQPRQQQLSYAATNERPTIMNNASAAIEARKFEQTLLHAIDRSGGGDAALSTNG